MFVISRRSKTGTGFPWSDSQTLLTICPCSQRESLSSLSMQSIFFLSWLGWFYRAFPRMAVDRPGVNDMHSLPARVTSLSAHQASDISNSSSKRSSITIRSDENRLHLVPAGQPPKIGDVERQVSLMEEERPLPLPDKGRRAWIFLAGCFLFEALVWGESAMGTIPW
jgi:hypothetical protein